MALIKIENLTKSYTTGKEIHTQALRGVDLEIQAGDFAAIAGPSGSGKSTLLNLIGALDTPDKGRVIFDGTEITGQDLHQLSNFRLQKIGFVFQAYNLINTLTALENVEYILLLQGCPKTKRRQEARDALAHVGLADYIHRFPNQMSGGQQQRVAVARAVAAKPKVILADEPTANLDSKTAGELIKLMLSLNEQHNMTFIFSTHDQAVMSRAKQLIKIHDGKIVS